MIVDFLEVGTLSAPVGGRAQSEVRALVPHVRLRRRELGLTQARLAEAVGVSRQTVIAIEGGDYSPSVHLALRIAGVLGTSVEALFAPVDDHERGGSPAAPLPPSPPQIPDAEEADR